MPAALSSFFSLSPISVITIILPLRLYLSVPPIFSLFHIVLDSHFEFGLSVIRLWWTRECLGRGGERLAERQKVEGECQRPFRFWQRLFQSICFSLFLCGLQFSRPFWFYNSQSQSVCICAVLQFDKMMSSLHSDSLPLCPFRASSFLGSTSLFCHF